MKWVADTTGRFQWRPYYEREELDAECEQIVSEFLKAKHGTVGFPISTDDLSVMLEQDTSDLDLYADLGRMGGGVEGVTEFFPDRKPAVRIDRELSGDIRESHRLRSTLAHEFGHVRFHNFLWDMAHPGMQRKSLAQKLSAQRARYTSVRSRLTSDHGPAPARTLSLSFSAPGASGLPALSRAASGLPSSTPRIRTGWNGRQAM